MSTGDIDCRVMEEELRSFWPQWHVEKRLGSGGYGRVFQIYKDSYGMREYSALKVIQVSSAGAEATVPLSDTGQTVAVGQGVDRSAEEIPEVLMNEIRIMETLKGAPNIVLINEYYYRKSMDVSSLFVRMELLTSFQNILNDRVRNNRRFSIAEVLKVGRDVCTALMYCEKKGIIHRDIKPDNIFLDSFGNYKVGDFGASKWMETVHATHTMTRIGTESYLAPEVYFGKYNNTVDIYSLGIVLYQLLNGGRIPFLPATGSYTAQDVSNASYRRLVLREEVPSLVGMRTGDGVVDAQLDGIIRKACNYDSHMRYRTAGEFYEALTAYMRGDKSAGRTTERVTGTATGRATETVRQNRYQSTNKTTASARQDIKYQRKEPQGKDLQRKEKNTSKSRGIVIGLILLVLVGVLALPRSKNNDNTNTGSGFSQKADNAVDWKDDALEAKMRDITGISSGDITYSDVESITMLDLSNESEDDEGAMITDVSALSGMTNLTSLYLNHNQISDISALSGLTNLTSLYLDNNQISDISALSGMTNLIHLYLDDNQISDISALRDLTELEHLSIYNNQISDISVLRGMPKLRDLSAFKNQISDISVLSGLTELEWLSLSGNQINDISVLSGLTKLESLDLNSNQINDISMLSGLTELEQLDLANNQISDISALSGLIYLKNLNLLNNQISDITALRDLTNLVFMQLSKNQISDISALSGMTKLEILGLSDNQISDISALSSLVNLGSLYLDNNQISDISALSGLTKLNSLHLEDNQITDYSSIENLNIEDLKK